MTSSLLRKFTYCAPYKLLIYIYIYICKFIIKQIAAISQQKITLTPFCYCPQTFPYNIKNSRSTHYGYASLTTATPWRCLQPVVETCSSAFIFRNWCTLLVTTGSYRSMLIANCERFGLRQGNVVNYSTLPTKLIYLKGIMIHICLSEGYHDPHLFIWGY